MKFKIKFRYMRKILVLLFSIIISTVSIVKAQVHGTVSGNGTVSGQEWRNQVITTAVPFLLIAPDSRIGGMGETGAAILDDANAQHWNPSKYLFAKNDIGFSVSYSPWLAGLHVNDIHLLYLSAYFKATKMDAVSFSLRYFSMGTMELTNIDGSKVLDAHPHEFAVDFAYTRILVEGLSMGITGRFIYSNLSNWSVTQDIKPGLAGAADISLFYTKKFDPKKLYNHNLNLGLNISNIGNKVTYSNSSDKLARDFLPANFRLGLAYDMYFNKYNKLTVAFDVNKLLVTSPPIYTYDNGVLVKGEDGLPTVDKGNGRNPYKTTAATAVFTSWGDAPGGFKEEMKEFILNFGLEYAYNDLLFLRGGFFNEAKDKGNRRYMTLGVGLKYSVFTIDAAYILPVSSRNSPLENTLRFSLSFEFKKVKGGN